jgi:hypothetical protein
MTRQLKQPKIGRLLAPKGGTLSHSLRTLDTESLAAETSRFEALRDGIERFYAIAMEGQLLAQILDATQNRSFLDYTLERARQHAKFSNWMSGLMSNADTHWHHLSGDLGMITLVADIFTKSPIPQNITANLRATGSVADLEDITEQTRAMYESAMKGVRVLKPSGSAMQIEGVEGIEFRLFADDVPQQTQFLDPDSSTVEAGDRVFYNGLPADRAKFPTLVLPTGSQISFRATNTSKNKVYLVVPTINGIPLHTKEIQMGFDGLSRSATPIVSLEPQQTYVKPGQERDYDGFQVDSTKIVQGNGLHSSKIFGYSRSSVDHDAALMAYAMARIHEQNLTPEEVSLLASMENDHLRERILMHSRVESAYEFAQFVDQPRRTNLYLTAPTIADDMASSNLDNPFLGSLGLVVFEVTRPPVRARHTTDFGGGSQMYAMRSAGGSKGIGGAGLAGIGGGADMGATRADWWESHSHGDWNHKFVGYFPVNVLSTTE